MTTAAPKSATATATVTTAVKASVPPTADPAPANASATAAPEASVAEAPPAPAPRRAFVTSVSDAPEISPHKRALNPKTIAEQKAGKEALSQYAPAAE